VDIHQIANPHRRSVLQVRLFVALVVCLVAGTAIDCRARYLGGSYERELMYADVVVHGVIDSISTGYVPEKTYWPGMLKPDEPMATTTISLRVMDVLRGRNDWTRLETVAPGAFPPGVVDTSNVIRHIYGFRFNFEVGTEVIYCLWYKPLAGGTYFVPANEGRFRKIDGSWRSEVDPDARLSLREIRGIVARADPARLQKEADLIVQGNVLDIARDTEDRWAPMKEIITMRVEKVWKGNPAGETVEFRFQRRGGPRMVPCPRLSKGDEYLVYLKNDGETLTAFAGVNGMLQVEGDELIRDNGVLYEISRSRLVKILRRRGR
jgi:hypothetical protein